MVRRVITQETLPFGPDPRSERAGEPVNPHLAAARRLSRQIRRLPDHSEAQTRAGQAICQHLQLLLRESESLTTRH